MGLRMPTSGISLPSLNYLNLQENDMVFTTPFQVEFFPQLLYLYLSGNHLKVFPAKNLKNILKLDIARCKLIDVPLAVSQYRDLRYLDARDNNITTVEDDLKALIEKNNVKAYFSGNAVCNEDSSLDCKPLCSRRVGETRPWVMVCVILSAIRRSATTMVVIASTVKTRNVNVIFLLI